MCYGYSEFSVYTKSYWCHSQYDEHFEKIKEMHHGASFGFKVNKIWSLPKTDILTLFSHELSAESEYIKIIYSPRFSGQSLTNQISSWMTQITSKAQNGNVTICKAALKFVMQRKSASWPIDLSQNYECIFSAKLSIYGGEGSTTNLIFCLLRTASYDSIYIRVHNNMMYLKKFMT